MSKLFLVCGLGFGDEGKGSMVDFLVRQYNVPLVVRYNGGAQAAHNVVLPDGTHHTFSQFGSGTLVPGVKTYLSEYVIVNPGALMNEEDKLQSIGVKDGFERLTVHPDCLITTRYHICANRQLEADRGVNKHGSCGMGVGETMRHAIENPNDAIRFRHLLHTDGLRIKLNRIRDYYASRSHELKTSTEFEVEDLHSATRYIKIGDIQPDLSGGAVFEGAQGVLLDQKYGFPPHQTYSTCTLENAFKMLNSEQQEMARKIGVIRTFMTRHGAGPLPTEKFENFGNLYEGEHNVTNHYQGRFRIGEFDAVLARYAIEASGVSEIALTHMDRVPLSMHYASKYDLELKYEEHTTRERQFSLAYNLKNTAITGYKRIQLFNEGIIPQFERILERPINFCSTGPTFKDKFETHRLEVKL